MYCKECVDAEATDSCPECGHQFCEDCLEDHDCEDYPIEDYIPEERDNV